MEFDDEIREFLIESNENLANLDRDIVQLEKTPDDMDLISSAFRTIHTIKGTCGFFGCDILGSVTHVTENILSQVRERQRKLTPQLISLILEAVDEVKRLLEKIETTGSEGEDQSAPLRARLEQAHQACPASGQAEEEVSEDELHTSAKTEDELLQAVEPRVNEQPEWQPASSHLVVSNEQGSACKAPALDVPGSANFQSLPAGLPEPTPSGGAGESSQDAAKDASRDAQLAESTIRVDVGLLNRLMNLVGELVLARNQLLQDTSAQNSSLQQTSQRLNLITSELQEGVMKTRMQPIGVVWNKLPRVVRDLASKCGKRVQIEMDGAGTELDKTIIEAIKDPLTHIVRNSCDHGIETPDVRQAKGKSPDGLLLLRAYHEGGVVNIEISDDGAGIDPEKVKAKAVEKGLIRPEQAAQMSARDGMHLIFMPGFSTAAQITSISGRGVGMDVVKTNIEKIGGSVEVLNRAEGGTTIRIKIPLTLAIIPGLVVTLDQDQASMDRDSRGMKEERFIIPQANLLELVRIEGDEISKRIENVHGTPVFHHRGKLLPLVYLGRVLGRTQLSETEDAVSIIVLQAENRQLGLVVNRICDTQEIVVKPLGRQLKGLSCYVGATIMGDGRPALILDVAGLARLAGLGSQTRQLVQNSSPATAPSSQPQMMLLFRAGAHERLAVPLSLVDRLEEISASKIERAGGRAVLYYRGDILPLVTLGPAIELGRPEEADSQRMAQIIVFTDGVRRLGLVVDQILDIVNEPITVKRTSSAAGLLGSALIGGKITDLIDLHVLVQSSGENWLDPLRNTPQERHRLLLVDPSSVAREMVSNFLDISGYEVVQAATIAEVNSRIRQTPLRALLLATGMPEAEKNSFLESISLDRLLKNIPIIELLDRSGQESLTGRYAAQIVRAERAILLQTLATFVQLPAPGMEAIQ